MSAIIYKLKCTKCGNQVNVINGDTDLGWLESYLCTKCGNILEVKDNKKPICKNCDSDKSKKIDIKHLDGIICNKCNGRYKVVGILET